MRRSRGAREPGPLRFEVKPLLLGDGVGGNEVGEAPGEEKDTGVSTLF